MQKHIGLLGGLVKLYMPHQNLGCLGIQLGNRYMGDLFQNKGERPIYGLYWRFGGVRHRFILNTLTYVRGG